MRETAPERRDHGSVDDPIKIRFLLRGKSCVKFIRSFLGFHDTNIAPEISVYRGAKFIRCEGAIDHHIRDLSFGVDPGIGASRTDDSDLRILEHTDHAFELALDRTIVFLHLPAVKVGTVVLDEKFVIRHFRLPGLYATLPSTQRGQDSG